MTFPFLRLPWLGRQHVIGQMMIGEVFVLSTISKRARKIVKICMRNQRLLLHFGYSTHNFNIDLKRRQREWVSIRLRENKTMEPDYKHPLWKLPIDISVPEDNSSLTKSGVIGGQCYDKIEAYFELLQFLVEAFPNSSIGLSLRSHFFNYFSRTLEIVDRKNIEKVWVSQVEHPCDRFAKLVLQECRFAKMVNVTCNIPQDIQYEQGTLVPFNYETIELSGCKWITPDHIINWFFNCKQVFLGGIKDSESYLDRILRSWMKGAKLEHLELRGDFDPDLETVLCIASMIRGADTVERTRFPKMRSVESRVIEFNDNDDFCFLIQEKGGKEALVYGTHGYIILTTYFRIGADLDQEFPYRNFAIDLWQ